VGREGRNHFRPQDVRVEGAMVRRGPCRTIWLLAFVVILLAVLIALWDGVLLVLYYFA
jgi:hypothetical protein